LLFFCFDLLESISTAQPEEDINVLCLTQGPVKNIGGCSHPLKHWNIGSEVLAIDTLV